MKPLCHDGSLGLVSVADSISLVYFSDSRDGSYDAPL